MYWLDQLTTQRNIGIPSFFPFMVLCVSLAGSQLGHPSLCCEWVEWAFGSPLIVLWVSWVGSWVTPHCVVSELSGQLGHPSLCCEWVKWAVGSFLIVLWVGWVGSWITPHCVVSELSGQWDNPSLRFLCAAAVRSQVWVPAHRVQSRALHPALPAPPAPWADQKLQR